MAFYIPSVLPSFIHSIYQVFFTEMGSAFDMVFETPGITDFVVLERMSDNVTEITVAFWMKTADKDNYGTPISYATENNDNAFTITDYSG